MSEPEVSPEPHDTQPKKVYTEFFSPRRGGILSDRSLRNSKISPKRLREDSWAMRWAANWAAYEISRLRLSWNQERSESNHYRDHCLKLYNMLTPEQMTELAKGDAHE